jgi:hypothetical protein
MQVASGRAESVSRGAAGSPGFLSFPARDLFLPSLLSARQLQRCGPAPTRAPPAAAGPLTRADDRTLAEMSSAGRFAAALLWVEACDAGAMFADTLAPNSRCAGTRRGAALSAACCSEGIPAPGCEGSPGGL